MADLYSIVIKENLDNQWADWFVGLTISINERDETVLTGYMTDQAELHGVLTRVRDLGQHSSRLIAFILMANNLISKRLQQI